MMTGLLRPDSGQVLVNGLDVWADPPAAKAIIGVVPAEAQLFERLSGEELLEYAGRLRGMPAAEARSRAAQLLDVLDLTADAKRLVADYSTGMRKKAGLGCALIHNPAVLFLDEPLEGVDPVSAEVIRRLLTRFVGSGSTVLFSSHVMELVEQVCDHVSIIDKGRIVATGTIDEVRGRQDPAAGVHRPGRRPGGRRGGDCRGSAPRPAETAPAAQRAALVHRGQDRLHRQHGLRRADRDRHLRPPGPVRGQSAAVDLTTVVFTAFAFGWLILPLVAFGVDGTLDPATLALYPLRTRPLAVGLLAASATGAWPLANVVGLLGVTVGLAHGAAGVAAAVVAVVLEVLFCITMARFVTTGMARLLSSRRGKDFAVLLVIPIFALYEAFAQVVPRLAAEGKLTAASFAGVDAWLRWLPPGLAAHAIQDASQRAPGRGAGAPGGAGRGHCRARLAVGQGPAVRPGDG